jgi:hypothetical protein
LALVVIMPRADFKPVHGCAKPDEADAPAAPQPESPRQLPAERKVVGKILGNTQQLRRLGDRGGVRVTTVELPARSIVPR